MKQRVINIKYILLAVIIFYNCSFTYAQKVVVDVSGKADFSSIQAAINSVPDSNKTLVTIFVKKGIYKEQLFITKSNLKIIGENKDEVIITQAIARDFFRCYYNNDWGVATMNLSGNDITLQNLTIQNTYGFDGTKDTTIACPNDTTNPQKRITKNGHQMALRTFATTRLQVINCKLKAYAGDTVSPWNTDSGMFYFKDCEMEGGVDFYCPRGWAYAENCVFTAHTGSASIWHDGSVHESSKTVLVNCSFKGFDQFKLGRYHRDAQFFLINCLFADNMANEKIYLVKTNNNIQWGERVYYFNCTRKAGNYTWFSNNLQTAKNAPKPSGINALWAFDNKWNPIQQHSN